MLLFYCLRGEEMMHDRLRALPRVPGDSLPRGAAAQLPAPLTSFIGRERELSRVCELLQEETVRLLTLTGPPGVGKTRLGIEVATRLRPHFTDGIFFLALASLGDPSLFLPTICSQLELVDHDEL